MASRWRCCDFQADKVMPTIHLLLLQIADGQMAIEGCDAAVEPAGK